MRSRMFFHRCEVTKYQRGGTRRIKLGLALALAASLVAALPTRAQQLSDEVIYKGVTNILVEGSSGFLFFPDTNFTINQEVDLLENIAQGGGVSDRIIAGNGNLGEGIYFFSDPNLTSSGNPVVVAAIDETGLLQDVGVYFYDQQFDALGGSNVNVKVFQAGDLLVASDVEALPEPSAMMLLGFGGLALLACLRPRRR
jgi:hypothetical protein